MSNTNQEDFMDLSSGYEVDVDVYEVNKIANQHGLTNTIRHLYFFIQYLPDSFDDIDIHRFTGISLPTVKKEMKKLTELGLGRLKSVKGLGA